MELLKPTNCGECGHLADCGGMEGQLSLTGGCFSHCGPCASPAGVIKRARLGKKTMC
jgi:hypothetical protein